ncbi:MAG: YbaN family protein [Phycisphaeraceae bacterium]|nr:YbaN family protein [Phycisphaeraceae bacterium]
MTTTRTIPAAVDLPRVSQSRVVRYGLAGVGVGFVGMGAAGVVVPGLPTTVFLILAAWCFARSCPWLTDRLIRNRFFGPFVKYLGPGAVMPRRAKIVALIMMWSAIVGSCWLIISRGSPLWVPGGVIFAGIIGTWYIARQGCVKREFFTEVKREGCCPLGWRPDVPTNPPCTTRTGASSKTH